MKAEIEFTTPRTDCPHPEWWRAPEDSSTEVEVTELVAAFVRAIQPEFVLETGTGHGHTAKAIGEALAKNGHGRLVTLETSAGKCAEAAERCQGLPVEVLRQDSRVWTPPEQIQFAWIDSAAAGRDREILHYAPWLTHAIIGIHDTAIRAKVHPVGDDIRLLFEQNILVPIFLPSPRGCCFAQLRRPAC